MKIDLNGPILFRKKLLNGMKLTVAFLLAACLNVSAKSYSRSITLNMQDVPLEKVFMEIKRQSGYLFFYKTEELLEAGNVSVHVTNGDIDKVVARCLSSTHFNYKIIDKTIILEPKPPAKVLLVPTEVRAFADFSGRVLADNGTPVNGASVSVKGSNRGTSTDVNGNFTIHIPESDRGFRNGAVTLLISAVGYEPQEMNISDSKPVNVTLKTLDKALDDIVVIGYGTQRKSDLTGAVSKVSEKDLTAYPAANAIQALQGRAPGVTVQSVNGEPGAGYKIRVRGATSINASSDPLFVIDGIVGGVLPPPEDIASIQVLKDASATAIYGSRAANGVVLVSTKSGLTGKARVSVNSSLSTQDKIGQIEVLNAREFVDYINEARGTALFDPNNIPYDTDWQSLIYRTGIIKNNQLSVSGGSEDIKYYISGTIYDQKGIIHSSEFNRMSVNSRLSIDLSDRLNVNLNLLLNREKQDGVYTQRTSGVNDGGVVISSLRFDPNQAITDNNGVYTTSKVGTAPYENARAVIDGRTIENIQENVQANLQGRYNIFQGFTFNSSLGIVSTTVRNGQYNNRNSTEGFSTNGSGNLTYRKRVNIINENYFNYKKSVSGRHVFDATAGYSYQRFTNEGFTAANQGFITDAFSFWNLGAGSIYQAPSSNISQSEISSFYGRLNYNFDERYLFTVTSRYDGASQFSEGNKWSYFPSGAFAWNIANEKFFPKNGIVSALKLRTSYGVTGNQAIGPYESLSRISPVIFAIGGTVVNAVRPTAISNKDLTWETTDQYDAGIDLDLFNGRISFVGDYYNKRTKNLLFTVSIPSFSGYQNRVENLGQIENKGFELMLNTRNLVNELKWSTGFNVTINRSKVLKLPEGLDREISSGPGVLLLGTTSILRQGEPIGAFFGYIYDGVIQTGEKVIPGAGFETNPGGEKFRDVNNDGVLNTSDRTMIGDPNENFSFGFNNELSYKNFTLNFFFQGSVGGDLYNFTKMELDMLRGITNASKDALNRWTPQNTNTNIPRATVNRNGRSSTRFIEDGSYVRLKNLYLGYNLPSSIISRIKVKSIRVYGSAQNVLTFTNYSGVDPEVAFRGGGNLNLGGDYDSYPNLKSFTVGLNLGF